MRKIGVDWKIVGFDSTIAPAEMAKQDYELWTVTVPYLSAGELMNLYFNSKNIPTPNRMNWKDPETDELLRARPRRADRQADRALNYAPVQEKVTDEHLWMPVMNIAMYTTSQKKTEGRPAAHALPEHLLQGPGLLVLMENLLEVRGLKTHFNTDRGLFRAVDGISFSVPRGRTVGLVGESGCGKSVTSLSVMGLVPSPPGKVEADAVMFAGRDVLGLSADERRRLRGGKMSMIFQEPMTSLNPVHTVGQQIVEAILAHTADVAAGRARPRHRDAGTGENSLRQAAHRRLSAQSVRRHAPARDDRDGAVLRAGAADRRRADHRARRHHPGADPRSARATCSAGSAWRS